MSATQKTKRTAVCNKDCFNCIYEDCIVSVKSKNKYNKEYQAKYRAEHREEIRKYQRRWYEENKEEENAKDRAKTKAKREEKYSKCHICNKQIQDGEKVYIYTSKAFCCNKCLGLYLASRSKIKPKVKGEL